MFSKKCNYKEEKKMLKGLKDVLWRGKADFSIDELERQKKFCDTYRLRLVLLAHFTAIVTFLVRFYQKSSEYDKIIFLIGSAIIIGIGLIMFVFTGRAKLCQKMIAYKYTEKKKKGILYYIKNQELSSLELVDGALKELLYKTSTEQEGAHFEAILTEENTVAIKVNGRIIENIYTWQDRLLDFFDPIIEDRILRGFF